MDGQPGEWYDFSIAYFQMQVDCLAPKGAYLAK